VFFLSSGLIKPRMAVALAALAAVAVTSTAHATYPGDNGIIVFQDLLNGKIGRTAPGGGASPTWPPVARLSHRPMARRSPTRPAAASTS
jgi:hypothetical protein